MARKRMIDPGFWDDLNIAKLSISARLCFIGMISNADDEGRIESDPRYIKRAVFGFDDEMDSGAVAGLLMEIQTSCPSVVFYERGGRALACFLNWKRYQYIQKPQTSRLPPPQVTDQYDSGNGTVRPNRIEKNRKEYTAIAGEPATAPEPELPTATTVVGALIDLGLFRSQAVGFVRKYPNLTVDDVQRWGEWIAASKSDNPIALMVKHLKEGRWQPPTNGNGRYGRTAIRKPDQPDIHIAVDQFGNEYLALADGTPYEVPE